MKKQYIIAGVMASILGFWGCLLQTLQIWGAYRQGGLVLIDYNQYNEINFELGLFSLIFCISFFGTIFFLKGVKEEYF